MESDLQEIIERKTIILLIIPNIHGFIKNVLFQPQLCLLKQRLKF